MATNSLQKHVGQETRVEAQANKRSGVLAAAGRAIRASYDPKPLNEPTIDRKLTRLPAVLRIAEVCRYSLVKLEYSLSSGGGLRTWFKLNLLIALLIAAPAVFVMPVITFILVGFVNWSEYLQATAINLFWATLYTLLTAVLITATLFVVGALVALKRSKQRP